MGMKGTPFTAWFLGLVVSFCSLVYCLTPHSTTCSSHVSSPALTTTVPAENTNDPLQNLMGFSPSSSCLISWRHLASLTFLKCGVIEKAWVLKHRDPGWNLCSSSFCSLYELGQVRLLFKSLLLLPWSFWCLFLGVVGRVKWDFVCEALSLVPGL